MAWHIALTYVYLKQECKAEKGLTSNKGFKKIFGMKESNQNNLGSSRKFKSQNLAFKCNPSQVGNISL